MRNEREPSPMRHVSLAEQGEPEVVRARSEVSGAEVIRRAGSKAGHAGRRRVKIVFFAANASDGERLGLDEEYRAIEQAIRGARYRDAFQLIPKLAVRRSDVQDALIEHSPDVMHSACYGSIRAELLLMDDGRGAAPMSSEVLAGLFKVLKCHVALVVFNACFASGQAEAIRGYAGFAVGMRAGIEDRAAIAFASGLYGALAYGRSVREGFELGVAAVAAVDPRQQQRVGSKRNCVWSSAAPRCGRYRRQPVPHHQQQHGHIPAIVSGDLSTGEPLSIARPRAMDRCAIPCPPDPRQGLIRSRVPAGRHAASKSKDRPKLHDPSFRTACALPRRGRALRTRVVLRRGERAWPSPGV